MTKKVKTPLYSFAKFCLKLARIWPLDDFNYSLDSPRGEKENCPSVTRYLYRTCPKCKDYLGVVVRDPPEPKREIPIDARCVLY